MAFGFYNNLFGGVRMHRADLDTGCVAGIAFFLCCVFAFVFQNRLDALSCAPVGADLALSVSAKQPFEPIYQHWKFGGILDPLSPVHLGGGRAYACGISVRHRSWGIGIFGDLSAFCRERDRACDAQPPLGSSNFMRPWLPRSFCWSSSSLRSRHQKRNL